MKKIIVGIVMIMTFLITSIDNVEAKYFPYRKIQDENKTWTIKFSQSIDIESIKNDNVRIEAIKFIDFEPVTKYLNISTKFNEDYTELTVTPLEKYEEDIAYKVVIMPNAKSTKGKNIKEETFLTFDYIENLNE